MYFLFRALVRFRLYGQFRTLPCYKMGALLSAFPLVPKNDY